MAWWAAARHSPGEGAASPAAQWWGSERHSPEVWGECPIKAEHRVIRQISARINAM